MLYEVITIDDVLCTVDIGFDTFHRIVLGDRDVFESCGMDDIIDPVHGFKQTIFISDITDKIAHAFIAETLSHFVLFEP